MRAATKRKVTALGITFVYLIVLGLGSVQPQYAKTADLSLLGLHFLYLTTLSIMLLRNRATDSYDPGKETMFKKWWRWTTDDYPTSSRPR
jgi:hypothetical protein